MGKQRHDLGRLRGLVHHDELAVRRQLHERVERDVLARRSGLVGHIRLHDGEHRGVLAKRKQVASLVDPLALRLDVLEGIRNQLAAFIWFY